MSKKNCFDCDNHFEENEGKMLILNNGDKLIWHFYCFACLKNWSVRALKAKGLSDEEIQKTTYKNKITK